MSREGEMFKSDVDDNGIPQCINCTEHGTGDCDESKGPCRDFVLKCEQRHGDEICPEAIEAADEIDDVIELARVSGNWEGTYTSIMATVDNAICKAIARNNASNEEQARK